MQILIKALGKDLLRNWGRYTKLCKILAPLPYTCIFQCSLWSTFYSNLLIGWLQTKHDLSTPFGFSLSNSNTVKNKSRQHPATLSLLAMFQQIRVLALHLEILFQHCSIMRQTDPCLACQVGTTHSTHQWCSAK